MKIKLVFAIAILAFVFVTCHQYKELVPPSHIRNLKPNEVAAYHQPINMTIAWVPYQEQKLVKTKKDEWKVVKHEDSDKTGNIPVILVTYPESTDTVWIDMNTSNELLGKLVKHSLMTQEPIRRPYVQYFEEASCQKCHPSDVKVNFD